MKKINKFIFITLTISSAIFTGRERPLDPSDVELELGSMTIDKHKENFLPSIEDIIIVQEELNLLRKKKMGEKLTFMKKASLLLEKKKLNNKLEKLTPVMQDLMDFRDYLNRMLALTTRLGPTMKTSQTLKDFLENLTTIFNMGHKFLEKEKNIIKNKAGTTKIFNTIILIMDGIYNNFNRQLQDIMFQAKQDLQNVT